jgi:hypothetical protein
LFEIDGPARNFRRSGYDLKTGLLKGSSTEIHADISTPVATPKDFQFTPPKDSVLKASLFGVN